MHNGEITYLNLILNTGNLLQKFELKKVPDIINLIDVSSVLQDLI